VETQRGKILKKKEKISIDFYQKIYGWIGKRNTKELENYYYFKIYNEYLKKIKKKLSR
jgi:hypothetical protein